MQVSVFKWPKYPIPSLLSIPIARYYSIKRLALEHLFSLNPVPLINLIGIISQQLKIIEVSYK